MGVDSPSPQPLSPEQKQALVEFLNSAPSELEGWAQAQLELLTVEQADAKAPSTEDALDESDDFYADMEGEDDVLQRPRKNGRKPGSGTVEGSPQVSSTRLSGKAKLAIVAALVLGAVVGIWYAGRDTTPEVNAGTPTMETGTSDSVDPMKQIDLEQQVQENPGDLDARLELGVMYFNQGQVTLASQQWEAVVEMDPQNVTGWYNLGFARISKDPPDTEGAKEAWQHVVDIAPDSELAQTVTMHLGNVSGVEEESGD